MVDDENCLCTRQMAIDMLKSLVDFGERVLNVELGREAKRGRFQSIWESESVKAILKQLKDSGFEITIKSPY